MKQVIGALLLTVLLGLSAVVEAKNIAVRACTADHYTATLNLVLVDKLVAADKTIEPGLTQAFINTGKMLPAQLVVGYEGFYVFVSQLTKEQVEAVEDINVPIISKDKGCSIEKTDKA